LTRERKCLGCGRDLSETGTHREAAGRRYSPRRGWHNATATACNWCGTWTRWDTDIPTTVEEVKKYADNHGMHFFTPGAMRFFGSRVAEGVTVANGRAYFITSERDNYTNQPRLYTVRYMVPGGHILEEAGGFQAHSSLRAARRALRDHLGS
jgi:hypothetical protein